MIRTLARTCLIAALLTSVGMHWAVVQSAAWAGMLVSYSHDGSLMEAVNKTFDGEHPCEYCKLVDGGTKEPEVPGKPPPKLKKLDWGLDAAEPIVIPECVHRERPEGTLPAFFPHFDDLDEPPPRSRAA